MALTIWPSFFSSQSIGYWLPPSISQYNFNCQCIFFFTCAIQLNNYIHKSIFSLVLFNSASYLRSTNAFNDFLAALILSGFSINNFFFELESDQSRKELIMSSHVGSLTGISLTRQPKWGFLKLSTLLRTNPSGGYTYKNYTSKCLPCRVDKYLERFPSIVGLHSLLFARC